MKYIALLRGVNAGGNRRVPMQELRQQFVSLGFSEVSTYINSGNVIFVSDTPPDAGAIQRTLEAYFGFTIDTLVLSVDQLHAIAAAIPDTWKNDYSEHKSDVCFLLDDNDAATIKRQISSQREFETLLYVPGAILSNVPRKYQPKSTLLKLASTPLYQRMTVRNATTVRKLVKLTEG